MSEQAKDQVVTDQSKGSFSDLWKKEDYWAIWLGFLILILGMIIYFPNGPTGYRDKIQSRYIPRIFKMFIQRNRSVAV